MRFAAALSLVAFCVASPALAGTTATDCAAEVEAMLTEATDTGPTRITVEATSNLGMIHMTGEIVQPDSTHVVVVFPDQTMEATAIGNEAWIKIGDTWTVAGPDTVASLTSGLGGGALEELAGIADPGCLGPTTIEGRELVGYTFAMELDGISSTNRLFIDPQTKFPVRLESEMSANGMSSSTVMRFEYDPTITVTKPVL